MSTHYNKNKYFVKQNLKKCHLKVNYLLNFSLRASSTSFGTILLISSKKFGNLYWEYDEDSVPDACTAFALAAQLYDLAVFKNGKSKSKKYNYRISIK